MTGLIIILVFIGISILAFSAVIQEKLAESIILFMGVG